MLKCWHMNGSYPHFYFNCVFFYIKILLFELPHLHFHLRGLVDCFAPPCSTVGSSNNRLFQWPPYTPMHFSFCSWPQALMTSPGWSSPPPPRFWRECPAHPQPPLCKLLVNQRFVRSSGVRGWCVLLPFGGEGLDPPHHLLLASHQCLSGWYWARWKGKGILAEGNGSSAR